MIFYKFPNEIKHYIQINLLYKPIILQQNNLIDYKHVS